MKKALSVLLLCAIISLMFTACRSENTDPDTIVGKWRYSLNEEYRDVLTEVLDDERVYVDIYYEFNEDGSGELFSSINDGKQSFLYEYDGKTLTMTVGTASYAVFCTVDKDSMTIVENGETAVFKRD